MGLYEDLQHLMGDDPQPEEKNMVRIKGAHKFKVIEIRGGDDIVVVYFVDEKQNKYSMDMTQEKAHQLTDELLDVA